MLDPEIGLCARMRIFLMKRCGQSSLRETHLEKPGISASVVSHATKTHMRKYSASFVSLLFYAGTLPAFAVDYTSTGSGTWEAGNGSLWSPGGSGGSPQPGAGDNILIGEGHTVIYNHYSAPGSGVAFADFGVANGNTVAIDGGVFSQVNVGSWMRIGEGSLGTVNINNGRFHFTNGTGSGDPNLQVGIRGGTGVINVGDGIGTAGSAILNLRDIVNGTANGASVNMNLGVHDGPINGVGNVIVHPDGLLEGDARIRTGDSITSDPYIRIGQHSSHTRSVLRVLGGGPAGQGGRFNARGHVEVGASAGARGLLHLDGAGALMHMSGGELTVGYSGTGEMVVENEAVFSRVNTPGWRQDLLIGRNGGSIGTITLRNGGVFHRGPGNDVGDLRLGYNGTGTLNIEEGGLFLNESGNWDRVGENGGSTGVINVDGGTFRVTGNTNLNIGQNGHGTFRQTSGITEAYRIILAENNGTGVFDLQGGTVTLRSNLFLGGAGGGSSGTGTAIATQTGGTLNIADALVVGLAGSHTATYTMTGGSINHTSSDITVGENGTGLFLIGADATVTSTSGQFMVGRNNGSSGTLFVDGNLTKTSGGAIRVGNGNTGGVDNTTGTGLLGGTGTIISSSGVRIGRNGTITGGTDADVGYLSVTGGLSFSAGGILLANFDAGGDADRLIVEGAVDLTGAFLDGTWAGGPTGIGSRYWLILNDGADPITGAFANTFADAAYSELYSGQTNEFVTIDGQDFAVFYNADFGSGFLTGGNDLLLSAIPEPGTAMLILLAGAAGLQRRRR